MIRIKGTNRGLAMALDGNGRWCYLDPKLGAKHAVAEAARKVACSGATPVGATNCLNFGNPEKPHIMWQFSQTIDGITKACEELEIPITGGNVSFYNETLGEGIYPTPVLGIVGILEDVHKAAKMHFSTPGRTIVLLRAGEPGDITDAETEFGSSEYAKEILGAIWGYPPELDLEKEAALEQAVIELVNQGLVESTHDCADGGIAVALAEQAFPRGVGAQRESCLRRPVCRICPFRGGRQPRVGILRPRQAGANQRSSGKIRDCGGRDRGNDSRQAGNFIGWQAVISATVSELSAAYENALEAALRTDPELGAAD